MALASVFTKIGAYPDADFAGLWSHEDPQDPICVKSAADISHCFKTPDRKFTGSKFTTHGPVFWTTHEQANRRVGNGSHFWPTFVLTSPHHGALPIRPHCRRGGRCHHIPHRPCVGIHRNKLHPPALEPRRHKQEQPQHGLVFRYRHKTRHKGRRSSSYRGSVRRCAWRWYDGWRRIAHAQIKIRRQD